MIDLISAFGIFIIGALLFAFAAYGIILFFSKKKYEIAYVDKYKQLIEVSKMNCPPEIREKKLIKSADRNYSGIKLGYIYGRNFMNFEKKWYEIFIIRNHKNKIYNPLSWGDMDKIAVADSKNIKLGNGFNIHWAVGGLNYEGFFIFEAEGDLTPTDVVKKTTDLTGHKEAILALKRSSKLVEEAAEGNPQIKGAQKMTSELPEKE